ncbi:hypothetical protein [Thalassomonas sp. M1454]|uniref:hypothetical protein n=1 Tax=Thalassomonas sp. M1454 TaxID=2594477 RepID=UPI00117FBAC8|nr:hypothetical protein [Thalassomonas sp. M1454]TRX57983.1 hypothetical protein FNN08_00930 [Thalassomonas sp. M1454]
MINITSAVLISIVNMYFAIVIYLSLHGWIVQHEESGMQLLIHLFITAPVILLTTVWLYMLSKYKKCSGMFWKFNLVSFLVPIMSMQTGVTYYHYDKVGVTVALVVIIALIVLYIGEARRKMCKKQ